MPSTPLVSLVLTVPTVVYNRLFSYGFRAFFPLLVTHDTWNKSLAITVSSRAKNMEKSDFLPGSNANKPVVENTEVTHQGCRDDQGFNISKKLINICLLLKEIVKYFNR